MKNRYRMFRRGKMFYVHDSETGKQESLRTGDKKEAARLAMAKNEAQDNRLLNLKIAEAHMSAHDPEMKNRTWQDIMNYLQSRKGEVRESTLNRMKTAFKSKPFDLIRRKKLVETVSNDFLRVLKLGGTSTNLWLRLLHNTAMKLDWLLHRVLSEAAWPAIKYRETRAITLDEHRKILAKEKIPERALYYEVLWHTGGSPVDIANLTEQNIDWTNRVIQFYRQKLNNQREPACIQIGPELETVLKACPQKGLLFPGVKLLGDKHRATEFTRRCRSAGLQGLKLYSYRYAWAERAQACGYPERFAMVNLGHSSAAIHRAYAKKARVICPSLEQVEKDFQNKKMIRFKAEEAA